MVVRGLAHRVLERAPDRTPREEICDRLADPLHDPVLTHRIASARHVGAEEVRAELSEAPAPFRAASHGRSFAAAVPIRMPVSTAPGRP